MVEEKYVAVVNLDGNFWFICNDRNEARVFSSKETAQKVGNVFSPEVILKTVDELVEAGSKIQFGNVENENVE